MSALRRSLLYDAVFLVLAVLVAVTASGSLQEWTVFLLVCCALEAPFDAWQAVQVVQVVRAARRGPRSTTD